MSRFLFWLFAALLTAAGLASATAETPQSEALRIVLEAKTLDDTANDPQWRASLAAALHQYCESVLVQVPRNTPTEDQWIDSEFEGISSEQGWERYEQQTQRKRKQQRFNRVYNSIEYARKTMRHVLSECSSITRDIVERKQVSPAAEALLWVRLSRFFAVEEETWRDSEIIGLISPKKCRKLTFDHLFLFLDEPLSPPGAHDENNICYWGWVENTILDHVVVPLLKMQ